MPRVQPVLMLPPRPPTCLPSLPPAQKENANVFFTLGMGLGNHLWQPHHDTHFVVVVNGKVCRPCSRLYPLLEELPDPVLPTLSHAYVGSTLTLLKRIENEGMDFAAHNVTITWLQARGLLK